MPNSRSWPRWVRPMGLQLSKEPSRTAGRVSSLRTKRRMVNTMTRPAKALADKRRWTRCGETARRCKHKESSPMKTNGRAVLPMTPSTDEHERATLGSMLRWNGCIDDVAVQLREEDFRGWLNQKLFR